jgi:hypothetical protein
MKTCISKIRELIITNPILESLLLKDPKKWNLMCGSLDVIESTQLAIDSYKNLNKNIKKNVGLDKLMAYGLFQALYIQEDSVLNLCHSIDIDSLKNIKDKFPELYEIRQLRNKGIGHPSREGNTNNTHNLLIDGDSIKLYSHTETGDFNLTEYKISECIKKQSQSLCNILLKVIDKMASIEKEHKNKYKNKKLSDSFPNDYQYSFGKICEAINLIDNQEGETLPQRIGREDGIGEAFSHSKDLLDAIDKFLKEIENRSLRGDEITFVGFEINYSKYPLEKLNEYFRPKSKSTINSKDARAYADSAKEHFIELLKFAKKLDDLYEN